MNTDTPHLPEGTLLGSGKYRIVRFIGAGGFGCTYEAEFPNMGIKVAIKEFYVSDFCDRDAMGAVSIISKNKVALVGRLREKFVREAQRLFKLKHPGIVSVTDIFYENGTSYYVMDFINGRSLHDLIEQEGPMSEAHALRCIGQVMDALEYVHSKNMLHLDIKPDNIMIDAETDRAILIDFGVSKQYDEIDGQNTSTILGMTPGYAPLEQADNSIKDFTPASDIYALGATLYTALTGEVPPSAVRLTSGKATLSPLPAGTSPATKNAIGKMMQPDASHRPQTVAAARALLAAAPAPPPPPGPKSVNPGPVKPVATVGTRHVASTSAGTKPIAAPSTKSKKWLWVAIAAIVVVAVAAAIFLSKDKPASEPISGYEEGYEWLDMGTSVKWATCNVGASSPTGKGTYFAWGETNPKAEYTEENRQTYDNENVGSLAGDSRYDAARANWGGKWRMPTKEDFQELIDKCKWEWDGSGMKVTAKNGNVLYLPAAGWQDGSSLDYVGSYGVYWSAAPDGSDSAWYLSFSSGGQLVSSYYGRFSGHSVRPVLE